MTDRYDVVYYNITQQSNRTFVENITVLVVMRNTDLHLKKLVMK